MCWRIFQILINAHLPNGMLSLDNKRQILRKRPGGKGLCESILIQNNIWGPPYILGIVSQVHAGVIRIRISIINVKNHIGIPDLNFWDMGLIFSLYMVLHKSQRVLWCFYGPLNIVMLPNGLIMKLCRNKFNSLLLWFSICFNFWQTFQCSFTYYGKLGLDNRKGEFWKRSKIITCNSEMILRYWAEIWFAYSFDLIST